MDEELRTAGRAGRGLTALSRRSLLVGSVAALATGCAGVGSLRPPVSVVTAPAERPDAAAVHTVDDLLASTPFYVAHRGSGDNWPEHTMAAYAGAVGVGAAAIEVSVCATADGVLVCHHDRDLERMSGDSRRVEDLTWADLQEVRIDARRWLGPNVEPEPVPRLVEVLDAFAASHVVFIEDKQGTNTRALLDLMDRYPDSHQHFVWKQWAGASQHQAAGERGYRTWGYLTEGLDLSLEDVAAGFDLLGVHHRRTDDEIAAVVAQGKPVICWEVHYRSMRERLLRLGVQGMMCSNLPYVAELVEAAEEDTFATGRRAPGDLPWSVDHGWRQQPEFDPLTRSVVLDAPEVQSYHLGSMSPVVHRAYRLRWEMRWPEELPEEAHQHAGIAFGQDDDADYRPLVPAAVGGYHLVLRRQGLLELHARAAGETRGVPLASVSTMAINPGEWTELELVVRPDLISCSRQGRRPWTLVSRDASYRGGYLSLTKNYPEPIGVGFRGVRVEPL